MGDQAQQEERVLQWLKKRGYTEVAKHYEEEQQQPGEGEGAAGEGHLKRRVGEANQNALLFRSVHLVRWWMPRPLGDAAHPSLMLTPPSSLSLPPQSDPSIYHRSYNELQTWICNALEAYKPELLTVSFPVCPHTHNQ